MLSYHLSCGDGYRACRAVAGLLGSSPLCPRPPSKVQPRRCVGRCMACVAPGGRPRHSVGERAWLAVRNSADCIVNRWSRQHHTSTIFSVTHVCESWPVGRYKISTPCSDLSGSVSCCRCEQATAVTAGANSYATISRERTQCLCLHHSIATAAKPSPWPRGMAPPRPSVYSLLNHLYTSLATALTFAADIRRL